MNSYYACDTAIAKLYCVGLRYIDIYLTDGGRVFWQYGAIGTLPYCSRRKKCVLLCDLNSELCLLLTLKDPLFKAVDPIMFGTSIQTRCDPGEWKIL